LKAPLLHAKRDSQYMNYRYGGCCVGRGGPLL